MGKIKSINPATEELNEEFNLYSQQVVNQKIGDSRKAFAQWKNEPLCERTFSIECVGEVLRDRKEELAELITTEMASL